MGQLGHVATATATDTAGDPGTVIIITIYGIAGSAGTGVHITIHTAIRTFSVHRS